MRPTPRCIPQTSPLTKPPGAWGQSAHGGLSLSDEQRERIHGSLIGFPDAVRRDAQEPALADRLSSDEPTQDLPENLMQEIPLLHAYKFVKLNDRILLVDPASRMVVAMIPRYRLLP
jgi:hypothetical protein